MKCAIADPPVKPLATDTTRPSYVAFRAEDDLEIGYAGTEGEGASHFLKCFLSVAAETILELRAVDPEFRVGVLARSARSGDPVRPSFTVHREDGKRIGTAFPHADGEGHRLKCRVNVEDGTLLELRPTAFYVSAEAYQPPVRRRTPNHRPRTNA